MSITFKDNSKSVLQTMDRSVEAALIKIGIAAKRNIQGVIVDKDIYDTGELHRTIDYSVRQGDKLVDVGSPKNYAPFQEVGTRFMPARPFIRPGILDNTEEYKNIAAETIGEKMK